MTLHLPQLIKLIKGWSKQREILMATYKAVMRPALEYASSISSPLASSTSINKLQVMQSVALRTATGYTQDTNIQYLHDETLILPIHEHLQLHATPHNTNRKHNIHHIPYTNIQYTSTLQDKKSYIFNNSRYTTNIPTDPHIITTTKQTCAIFIHTCGIQSLQCRGYCLRH